MNAVYRDRDDRAASVMFPPKISLRCVGIIAHVGGYDTVSVPAYILYAIYLLLYNTHMEQNVQSR